MCNCGKEEVTGEALDNLSHATTVSAMRDALDKLDRDYEHHKARVKYHIGQRDAYQQTIRLLTAALNDLEQFTY